MPVKSHFFSSLLIGCSKPEKNHTSSVAISKSPLLAAVLMLAVGCKASADNAVDATLDTDFQIRVDQTAILSNENIIVGFIAISSDSRCGKGEKCVWEGDAIVRVWLEVNGGQRQERELHTASREANAANFGDYNVRLVTLLPPPLSGRSIAASDYVATMRVMRGYAAANGVY